MRKFLAVYFLASVLPWLGGGCATTNSSSGAAMAQAVPPPRPPRPPHLVGSVSQNTYISDDGHFSVPFPVSPEVNGRIQGDTADSVTFHDNWGSQISFHSAAFNSQSSMTATLKNEGRDRALEAFANAQYGNLITPHHHPEVLGGAISFLYLRPVGPKTGVAAFIAGERVYWVTTDLLPGVQLLAQTDAASQEKSDDWLEAHALELAQSMQIR